VAEGKSCFSGLGMVNEIPAIDLEMNSLQTLKR
jgi:hypothetical protein